jgi:hypothetical protein
LGFIFTIGFYLAPEFVTLQQFPDAEGKGLEHLITLRYALGSLIACIVIITFQLRNIEELEHQKSIMLGYGVGFFTIFITNLTLQLTGKINAIPPIIATGLIFILSSYSWWNLHKNAKLD